MEVLVEKNEAVVKIDRISNSIPEAMIVPNGKRDTTETYPSILPSEITEKNLF